MTQNIFFDVIARDKASSTLTRVGAAGATTQTKLAKMSKGLFATATGLTSVTLAAGAFVRVGADYVGSLNKIQALTNATPAQMKRAASALEAQSSAFAKMGQTTGDAANGVVELTKAGLSLDSALKAVSATMTLAKAGELSVADASSLVANTLNTFHLSAKRAGDVANYLANAANISSADVADIGEAFKYVAPIAASTGVSLAQTNAILAELANSGIDASNAGTGFRKFLLSLQKPSGAAAKDLKSLGVEIFTASGKMKPLSAIIGDLGPKIEKLSDQKRSAALKDIFGLQGIASAQVILSNGAKGLATYTKGVEQAGAAQKLAEANSKGFAGTLSALKAEVISDAQAYYRKLSPSLDDAAKKLLVFVQQMKSGQGTGGEFVHMIKELADAGIEVVKVINGLPGPIKKYGAEMLVAGYAVSKLSGLTTSLGEKMKLTGGTSASLMGAVKNLAGAGGLIALTDGMHQSDKALGALETTLGGAAAGFAAGGPIGAAVGGLAGGMLGLFRATHKAGDAAKDTIPNWQAYAQTLVGVDEATSGATRAMILQRLTTAKVLDTTRELGLSDRLVVSGIEKEGPQRQKLISILQRQRQSIEQNAAAKEKELAAEGQRGGRAGATYAAAQIVAIETERKAREKNINTILNEVGAVDRNRFAQLKQNVAIAETAKEATTARKALEQYATKYHVDIDTGQALTRMQLLNQQLAALKNRKVTVTVALNNASHAQAVLNNLGLSSGGRFGGQSITEQLAAQITKGLPKVKTAIGRTKDMLQAFQDKVTALTDLRNQFTSTFSSDSIFGAQIDTADTTGTLNDLMTFQSDQAKKAQQLLADVRAVASKGLSKSLAAQLQSAGSSGAEQLHLLAGASVAQIKQFNALNAASDYADQQAGLLLGNYGRGGNINADISTAKQEAAIERGFLRALSKMKLESKVKGGDLIIAVRTTNHDRGRAPGDFTR